MIAGRSALCLLAALSAAGPGCGKRESAPAGPAPELTGLAVVPASAEVIVGAELGKLAGSPVVERAAEQLLLHDAALAERWQRIRAECKIDVGKQIKRLMLALGPATDAVGTGPVLMVAVGALPEPDLKDCVTRLVGTGTGSVTGKSVLGRTLYVVRDGNRTMYFAYTRADTIVLGASEAYVTEALGTGKKAPDNPDMTRWRALVNQNAPLWAVGRTDPRIRDGLVQLTEHKISAGPVAFAASADLADGAQLALHVVMSAPEQAKSLETYAKTELALLTAAAQMKSLGPVVGKIAVTSDASVVQFRAALSVEDLNQLLSMLDEGSTPAQNRAPAPSGTGSDH